MIQLKMDIGRDEYDNKPESPIWLFHPPHKPIQFISEDKIFEIQNKSIPIVREWKSNKQNIGKVCFEEHKLTTY